jgi:hypothetical protein
MSEKCSCGKFQDLKLPYRHAIVAISYSHYSIGPYVSDVYLQKTYYNTYKASFSPIDTGDLERHRDYGPYGYRKQKGRPKKKRLQHRDHHYIRQNKCSVCREEGHTRRSWNFPGSGIKITITSGARQSGIKIWRHLPPTLRDKATPTLRDEATEWIDPFHHSHIIYDRLTPLPEHVIEAPSKIPDPISERPSWRKDYKKHLRRIQAEYKKQ